MIQSPQMCINGAINKSVINVFYIEFKQNNYLVRLILNCTYPIRYARFDINERYVKCNFLIILTTGNLLTVQNKVDLKHIIYGRHT